MDDARISPPAPRWATKPAAAGMAALLLAFALWAALFAWRGQRAGDSFDIVRWEVTAVANKWLFAIGAPLRGDPDADEALRRYFALADRGAAEGRRLENAVEAAIEGRIDAVLRGEGVQGRVPLPFSLSVWPPVDVELAPSPRVFVTSPRTRILRTTADLLRPDLTLDEVIELEARAEGRDPSLSALVVGTGGVALYPAVVSNRRSYAGTVDTAAHEWTHHYMAFYPLGIGVPSGDRRVINETVADVVAEDLAALVLERFGDPTAAATVRGSVEEAVEDGGEAAAPNAAPPAPGAGATLDRDRVLRDLRVEVDALLAAGEVEEAERRMEQVRLELERAGVRIRRINQAYFAWFGSYAARADATDPLGPQLRELRERAGSLAAFLAVVRGADSRDAVERLLAGLRLESGGG